MNDFKPWGACAPILALLAACASTSPAPVLLTLPAAASPAAGAAPSAAVAAPLLAVRRVTIPEYLIARRVRYRTDASTLAEWPNTFWAERIEIGISREFVSALHQQLPGWALCDTNCGDQVPVLSLQVDLVPMDYVRSAQHLHAKARLVLSGAGAPPRELQVQELSYDIPAIADTAQAHAQAITALIHQVAQAAAILAREAPR